MTPDARQIASQLLVALGINIRSGQVVLHYGESLLKDVETVVKVSHGHKLRKGLDTTARLVQDVSSRT